MEKVTGPDGGESFEYCNLNYGTLGLVIESVTGESYEQYVEENIFAPLGMSNSYASYQEAQQHDLAQGYLLWWGMPKPFNLIYNRAGLPSGYLMSSAEAVSHYLIAQLNGGRFGDVSVLSEAGVAEMHLDAAPTTMMGAKAYGMGRFITEMDDEPVMWHAGGVATGHSDLILSLETGYGIFIVFNSSHILDSAGSEIAKGVFSLLLGHQPPTPAKHFPTAQAVLLGVLIIQVTGIALSLNAFKRWRSQPESMPRSVEDSCRHEKECPAESPAALPFPIDVDVHAPQALHLARIMTMILQLVLKSYRFCGGL